MLTSFKLYSARKSEFFYIPSVMAAKKRNLKRSPIYQLSTSDLCLAVGRCLDNGYEYLEESKLLLNAGHIKRATALAILGIEEVGKIEILAATTKINEDDKIGWKKFWTDFTTHDPKQARLLFVMLANIFEQEGPGGFKDLIPITVTGKAKNNPRIDLETVKQQCLYVGYDTKGRKFMMLTPKKQLADQVIRLLHRALLHYRSLTDFSLCMAMAKDIKTMDVPEKTVESWRQCKKSFLNFMEEQGYEFKDDQKKIKKRSVVKS